MNLYFDTSAYVKLYHKEIGSGKVERLILNPDNKIFISEITILEIISSLHKKFRCKEINGVLLSDALVAFRSSLSGIIIQPFSNAVLKKSDALFDQFGKENSLRTLDSIQFATFLLIAESDWTFICADDRLCKIVELCDYKYINPNN